MRTNIASYLLFMLLLPTPSFAVRWPINNSSSNNADVITSPYGPRQPNAATYQLHWGLDIRADSPMPVYAIRGGTVRRRGNGFGGNYIEINNSDGTVLKYWHLNAIPSLLVGSSVSEGSQIATSGNSGTIEFHLHVGYYPLASYLNNNSKRDQLLYAYNPMNILPHNQNAAYTIGDITYIGNGGSDQSHQFKFDLSVHPRRVDINRIVIDIHDTYDVNNIAKTEQHLLNESNFVSVTVSDTTYQYSQTIGEINFEERNNVHFGDRVGDRNIQEFNGVKIVPAYYNHSDQPADHRYTISFNLKNNVLTTLRGNIGYVRVTVYTSAGTYSVQGSIFYVPVFWNENWPHTLTNVYDFSPPITIRSGGKISIVNGGVPAGGSEPPNYYPKLLGNMVVESGGTLELLAGLDVNRRTWFSISPGGRVTIQSGGTLRLFSHTVFRNCGMFTNLGTINVSGSVNAELRLNCNSMTDIAEDMNINSEGCCIVVEDGSTLRVGANKSLTFSNGGFLVVKNTGIVSVDDAGKIRLEAGGGNSNAEGGANFTMGSGSSITAEGKFHAIGTAQSPIVFQGINGAWWNGIRAKSGNFSGILGDIRLEHVNIFNTTKPIHLETPVTAYIANATLNSPYIGIEILPNYNLFVEPPTPPTMQLNAVTINNTSTYGITVENFSDITIGSCVVSGYQAFAGIALTNSSPKILESRFQGFEVGIWGVANSAPLLFDQGIGGYNVFTSNITAAQFEGNSNAALGIDDGVGGRNAFTQYQQYAIVLADNSVVHSEWNWYDTPSPTQNLFSVTGGSKLYWEPYLTSPPGGNAPMARGIGQKEGDDPRLTLTDPRMKEVLRLRVQSRNTEASALLVAIVADGGATMQIKRWALGQLLAVSQMLRAPNLAAYLNALRATMPQVRQYLAELMPSAHMHERSVPSALDWYNDNIRNHANSITEAQALYGKFSHALFGAGDRTEAQAMLSNLQNRYARSGQARLALAQWNTTPTSSPVNSGLAKNGTSAALENTDAKPSVFALHQNYPNPFNPSTTLNFDLPEPSHVSLVVYDVLGRKVAELANRSFDAGYQSVTWNASSVASGVYFARFTAIPQGGTSGNIRLSRVSKLILAK